MPMMKKKTNKGVYSSSLGFLHRSFLPFYKILDQEEFLFSCFANV